MNYQKDVSDFMILGEQKISPDLNLNNEQTQLYMNLIKEEFEETAKAFDEEDLIEVADGLADMVWVIMGMCNSVGIDFDKIWEEVKSSNMSKFVDGKFIKNEQTQLYMNLIKEEFEETAKAFEEEDLVEVADGLADMVWVIMGMCNSVGIDFDKIWEEVKSSNMSKFVDGKFIKNDAGKIMKPETYFKPNIKKALGL